MLLTSFLLLMRGDLGQVALQRDDQLVVQLQPLQVHSIRQLRTDSRELGQHRIEGSDPRLDQVGTRVAGEDARMFAWINESYWESWRSRTGRSA